MNFMMNALNAKIIRVRNRGSMCKIIVRGRGLGGVLGYMESRKNEVGEHLE